MSTSENTLRLDHLLSQAGWLRRMARALLGDEALAEDAVQQTVLTALEKPPAVEGNLRGWFGTVLLNKIRGEARRRKVAEAAGRAAAISATPGVVLPAVPTPEDTTSNLQLQRRVAALLLELDPKVRQVVYLRYFEELDSVEIGRRLGESAGTVRWRLKTGIEELRRGLDRQDEREGDWRRALLPLAPAMYAGAKAGSMAWAAALGIAALVGAGGYLLATRGTTSSSEATTRQLAVAADRAPARRDRPPALQVAAGDPAPVPPPPPSGPMGKPLAARRTAPFSALAWAGDKPSVRVGDQTVELLGIDGLPIEDVIAHAKRTFVESPELWRKRMGEDLVEVLTGMGRPPTDPLPLQIRRPSGQTETVQAAMTADNRRQVWEARGHPVASAKLVDRFSRVSPFSGLVFQGEDMQVQVEGVWYRLGAIDGMAARQLVEASKRAFGSRWQKRLAEDMVEVLTAARGQSPGSAVDLVLEEMGTGRRVELTAVAMTEENRQRVKATWR